MMHLEKMTKVELIARLRLVEVSAEPAMHLAGHEPGNSQVLGYFCVPGQKFGRGRVAR